jgi:hypothetical protein
MTSPLNPPARPVSRRDALALLGGFALLLTRPVAAAASPPRVRHPEPRPGITGANVLDPADVPQGSREGYQAAREIPQILDGLYCHCNCGERDHLRSLLSCFETRMPVSCSICSGEARMALRLHRSGGTLASIRKAIDRRYD